MQTVSAFRKFLHEFIVPRFSAEGAPLPAELDEEPYYMQGACPRLHTCGHGSLQPHCNGASAVVLCVLQCYASWRSLGRTTSCASTRSTFSTLAARAKDPSCMSASRKHAGVVPRHACTHTSCARTRIALCPCVHAQVWAAHSIPDGSHSRL
ncbi:hypothetical protein EON67_01585 [archaeon]|nr:MAG: hypothetical protein EON67_01585 [archaeon]